MKASVRMLLLGATLLLLLVSTATAGVGFGPYADRSGGGGEMEWDDVGGSWDIDAGSGAVGFALDTSPIGPSRFSYRLYVGVESQTLEDDDNVEMELVGGVVENVFAFAIVNKPNLRWWAGPLVRFGFYSGETDPYVDFVTGDRYETEADLFEFGIGGVTGLNIPVGKSKRLILAPSVGVRFIGIGGEGTVTNLETGTSITDDLSGGISMVFVNFALLFD